MALASRCSLLSLGGDQEGARCNSMLAPARDSSSWGARDVGIRCLIQNSDFPVPIRIFWNRDEEYIKKLNAGVPHNTQQRIDALSTTSKLPINRSRRVRLSAAATKNELGQNERRNLACGGSSVRRGMFGTESLEWVTGEWSSAHGPGAMGTSTGIGRGGMRLMGSMRRSDSVVTHRPIEAGELPKVFILLYYILERGGVPLSRLE
ncbi:hypothetical protein C8F04DRAFT_1310242 [Mycena alexandri]|uniref:Uncharacterized protein n=1 Tax=Mycena alexandri TaxID=1745969 RepID=A0AAD6S7U9_9AGAR|nr:hypothetical protein C8F04DRAFT_1310242 [Mycena alexandri]